MIRVTRVSLKTSVKLAATALLSACNITEAGNVLINIGVLPVWFFHNGNPDKKTKVYALLDNASGETFVINMKSAKALWVEGSNTDFILTIIQGRPLTD